jgi:hypothetical protein
MKKLLTGLTIVVVLSWLSIVGAFTGVFFFDSAADLAAAEGAESLMVGFVGVTLALTAALFIGNKVSGKEEGPNLTKEQKKAAKAAETAEIKKLRNKAQVVKAKRSLEKAEKSFGKVKANYEKAVKIENGTYVAPVKTKKTVKLPAVLTKISAKFNFKEQAKLARQRKLEKLQRQINGQPEPKVTKAQKIELKKVKKVEKAKAKLEKLTTAPASVIPVLFRKKQAPVAAPVKPVAPAPVAPAPVVAPVVETPKVDVAPVGTVVNVDPAKGTATVRTSRFDRIKNIIKK